MSRKRTKAIDITGRWNDIGDRVIHYTNIDKNTKCTKCNGTDENCPLCHGESIRIEKKPKWYQLKKRLENWLENYEE